MGSNTLTNLVGDVYAALDVVSREMVGLIPAVTLDPSLSRVAVGQNVTSVVAPAATAYDITPAATAPDNGDQVLGNKQFTISKSRGVPFRWNGEQSLAVNNAGHGVLTIQQQQIAQAFRTLINEMESDLAALHSKFSRAYGTAGTTPFATAGDFTDAAEAARILDDNGAPKFDRHLILNSAAAAKLIGKNSAANTQGDNSMLRQGVLLDHAGFALRQSAQIKTSTAGTASSATTDNAGYAVGATEITLASAGIGTIVAGDVITFAGDTNKYVVESGDADVSNGGTITIAAPGLRVAMSAATKAITVVAAAARNMAFSREAIILGTRLPALPPEGDMAQDRVTIVDPMTGMSFELAMYGQYRQMRYEIGAAWGCDVNKVEHTALLLG